MAPDQTLADHPASSECKGMEVDKNAQNQLRTRKHAELHQACYMLEEGVLNQCEFGRETTAFRIPFLLPALPLGGDRRKNQEETTESAGEYT